MWVFVFSALLILSIVFFEKSHLYGEYGIGCLFFAIMILADKILNKLMNTPTHISQTQQSQQQPKMTVNTNNTSSVQRADVCPLCGGKVQSEALFCNNCGTKLLSPQNAEITDLVSMEEKHPADRGVAALLKKVGVKRIFNIVCIVLSVVSLIFAVFLMVKRSDWLFMSWDRYDRHTYWFIEDSIYRMCGYYFIGLLCSSSVELVHIIYIRYKLVHKGRDMTITDAIISTVMTAAPLLVLIFVWNYYW